MNINWFTLIAQIFNFLILMWLLKHYLYKPILKAIDERENKILAELKEAKDKMAEAERERDEFDQKNNTFDRQKDEMMQKVISQTNEEEQRLKEKARNEADILKAKLEKKAVEEREKRNNEISQRVGQEVVAIVRKTLSDLSSVSLEEQSVKTFIQKLNALKEDEKKRFLSELESGEAPILIESAFELEPKLQSAIKKSISELFGKAYQFRFKTMPELIGGIQLTANGYRVSWNISAYLKSFEKNISKDPEKSDKNSIESK